MTSIIPEPARSTTPHRPAAAALARLAALPLPDIYAWQLFHPDCGYTITVSGQLMGSETFDTDRLHLSQFAAVLNSPQWRIDRHRLSPGGKLSVVGQFADMQIEVWMGVGDEHLDMDVAALAELDEPVAGGAR